MIVILHLIIGTAFIGGGFWRLGGSRACPSGSKERGELALQAAILMMFGILFLFTA